jgi:hypothetical protein
VTGSATEKWLFHEVQHSGGSATHEQEAEENGKDYGPTYRRDNPSSLYLAMMETLFQ